MQDLRTRLPRCPAARKTTKQLLPSAVRREFRCKTDRGWFLTTSRGYLLWDEELGGLTPCYSMVSTYLTAPAEANAPTLTVNGSAVSTTSNVVNVVFARNYPINGTGSGLSAQAKTGIGAGVGVGGAFAFASLAAGTFLCYRRRKRRRETGPGRSRRGVPAI
jgi:hypothetical protein